MIKNNSYKFLLGIILVNVTLLAQAQDCNDNILESTPVTDFILYNTGTVTHKKTKLMWKVCSEGQVYDNGSCNGEIDIFTWQQALEKADLVNASGGYNGYTDWRVPNVKELASIIESKCKPFINEIVFLGNYKNSHWTSSPLPLKSYHAWVVSFNDGSVYYIDRSDTNYALLVRDTP